jgi:hypothetical protein
MIFRTHTCHFHSYLQKGKSLKSEGMGMPRDKNKGLHGACRTKKTGLARYTYKDIGDTLTECVEDALFHREAIHFNVYHNVRMDFDPSSLNPIIKT